MEPLDWVDDELARLERDDLLRDLPLPLRTQGATVWQDKRELINFASNDYLGLASDARLIEAAIQATREHGLGRGASPLVCGRSEIHQQLEQRLAEFFQTEAALLFPTSFAANAGVIPALVDEGDAIYGDAKNHASIIDGCRLSRADRHIYPHCDIDALQDLLRAGHHYRRRLIVTDTLFSMDGDLAPLPQIMELANEHGALVMLDETHAVGVFGEQGRGVAEHFGVEPHLHIGTFGKALGAAGGFVCASSSVIRWLANRARTYVFSTAHPAAVSAAALRALEIVVAEPQRRTALLTHAEVLRQRLQGLGWDTGQSVSQVIPIQVGSASQTMHISQALRRQGIWLPGIRPPSVPQNQSLLRLGLTAMHSPDMVDVLCNYLEEIGAPRK